MKSRGYKWIIGITSLVIPLVVSILIFSPGETGNAVSSWIRTLPHLNALLNTATALILIAGFVFIKKGQKDRHKMAMMTAFALGSIFLVSYIIYHSNAPSVVFGDINHDGELSLIESESVGSSRTIYIGVLLSHILLAAIVVPFVLLALFFALTAKFERHKKIVKFTFPIWLYVSVSGVFVYLMISQYY